MKISIITINYNKADGLQKTIESVLAQEQPAAVEFIIVDGASKDNSTAVMQAALQLTETETVTKGEKQLGELHIKWLSEPDTGIYNAMNKGIRMATGDYLLFLNSGDWLVDPTVVKRVLPHLGTADVLQGNIYEDSLQGKINRGYGRSGISLVEVYRGHFLHQATFFRTAVFQTYGLYDETLKANADTFYYFKILGMGHATFAYIDEMISVFEMNGISSRSDKQWREIIVHEDQLYDQMVPPRILQMVKTDSKKYDLYDTLHRYPIVWKLTMLLKVVAQKFIRKQRQQQPNVVQY